MRIQLAALGVAAVSAAVADAAVVLNGNAGTFPAPVESAVFTTSSDATERDVRPSARNLTQTFQVTSAFQLDAILIRYQAPQVSNVTTYTDGTFNIRIFPVADVNATTLTGLGADLLNVPVTLDASARSAAGFTNSNTVSSTLKFDLTGTDEILLPATIGTAGYALQFNAPGSATSAGFFAWQRNVGDLYSGGRLYDLSDGAISGDATLSLVPEPSAVVGLALASGLLGMRRRARR